LLWFLNINFFCVSNAENGKKKKKEEENGGEHVKKSSRDVENSGKKAQLPVKSRLDRRSEKLISLFGFDSGDYTIVIRNDVDISV
jgi:hypothetical protein